MADRPILFSASLVHAIIDGHKTVTRRLVRVDRPAEPCHVWADCLCREIDPSDTPCIVCDARHGPSHYGNPGDRLWVREAWRTSRDLDGVAPRDLPTDAPIWYDADGDGGASYGRGRSSIHMPRWASRLTLDVISVTVEKLQAITDADAQREGVPPSQLGGLPARASFAHLWDSINASRGAGWVANPLVWRVSFVRSGVTRG